MSRPTLEYDSRMSMRTTHTHAHTNTTQQHGEQKSLGLTLGLKLSIAGAPALHIELVLADLVRVALCLAPPWQRPVAVAALVQLHQVGHTSVAQVLRDVHGVQFGRIIVALLVVVAHPM